MLSLTEADGYILLYLSLPIKLKNKKYQAELFNVEVGQREWRYGDHGSSLTAAEAVVGAIDNAAIRSIDTQTMIVY